MRWRVYLAAALCLTGTAHAMQPGASGSLVVRNAVADLVEADGGDSTSGTTRAANKPKLKLRRADNCAAQTDGEFGEPCLDDFSGLWQCSTTTCNAAGWELVGTGRLIPSSQTLSAASTQITVTTSYRSFTLTPSGTTTLTATPTIATSGVDQGQILALFNVNATGTDCAVFRDKSILASSGLSLRASTRTLCPGDGGLFLLFNGTDWEEIAPGTIRVLSGSTDKGLLDELIFGSAAFSITGNTITTTTAVSLLSQTIEPNETTGAFAFYDTAQTWSALQTLEAGLIVEPSFVARKADNTALLDCGSASSTACRYTGVYSNSTDVATKGNVSARYTTTLQAALNMAANAGTNYVTLSHASTAEDLSEQPISTACTVSNMRVYAWRFGAYPTGSTWTVTLRKNASATGAPSISFSSLTFATVFSDTGTTLAFAAADKWSVKVACTGTCTDAGTTMVFRISADCTAGG